MILMIKGWRIKGFQGLDLNLIFPCYLSSRFNHATNAAKNTRSDHGEIKNNFHAASVANSLRPPREIIKYLLAKKK